MSLNSPRLWCLVILLFACTTVAHAAGPQAADLLPATTHHFLSIPDAAKMEADWKRTHLARLMEEPGMDSALKQATQQGIDGFGLGIRWEDLEAAGGEIAWALVQPTPKKTGRVFLFDTTGKADAAKKLLANLSRRLGKSGYELSRQTIDTIEVRVATKDGRVRYFVLRGSFFIAASNLATMKGMLAGKRETSLARVKAYQEVRKRSQAQTKTPPSAFVYSAPFELAKARLRVPLERPGRDMLALAERQGFDSIKAVGTVICFGTKAHELSYHMAVYAPGPYRNAARLLRFSVGKEFPPPDWVPANLSACATLYFDASKGLSALGSVFDEVYGNGKKGTFDSIVNDWKNDPNGPKVDVEKDIVGHLTRRITLVTDADMKLGPHAARTLVAFETTNPAAVSQSLRRMLETDEEVKRRDFKGFVVWEILPKPKKRTPGAKRTPTPPRSAVCVAHGHLLFANNIRLLERVLTKSEAPLAKDGDFERVRAELERLSPANVAMRVYTRPDQDYRVAYEALRSGKLAKSKSLYAVLLAQVIGGGENVLFDPKKLPAFERLVPHLGPAGMFLIPMEDGWVLNGFSLQRKP
jgi:hypothetical protein